MSKPNLTIFLAADEAYNAGERDYLKAMVAQLNVQGWREDTDYLFFKIPSATAKDGDPAVPPGTDAAYAALPTLNNAHLAQLSLHDHIQLIGMGSSTAKTLLDVDAIFPGKSRLSLVTHMLEGAAQAELLAARGVHVFAPVAPETLGALAPNLARTLRLTQLDAVPHTNSLASCQMDEKIFHATSPNGPALTGLLRSGNPFAFVVLNAGFEVGKEGARVYVPYYETEAAAHGAALGHALPHNAGLILVHGGPRNLRDETPSLSKGDTHQGQQTTEAFLKAFMGSRGKTSATTLLVERFRPGLPYNIIKAGYVWARENACVVFVSNSEGYGTMDGAALHLDNQSKILGMFPFEAQHRDPTGQRQENIEKYNRRGIALLTTDAHGTLAIERHPEEEITPVRSRDGAQQIAQTLGL